MKYAGVRRDVSDIASEEGQAHNLIGSRLNRSGEMRRRLCVQRANLANAGEPIRNMIGFNFAPGKTAANTFVASGGMSGNESLGLAYPIGYIPPSVPTWNYIYSTTEPLALTSPMTAMQTYIPFREVGSSVDNLWYCENNGAVVSTGLDFFSLGYGVNNLSISPDGASMALIEMSNVYTRTFGGMPASTSQVASYASSGWTYAKDNANHLIVELGGSILLVDSSNGSVISSNTPNNIPFSITHDMSNNIKYAVCEHSVTEIARYNPYDGMSVDYVVRPGGIATAVGAIRYDGAMYYRSSDGDVAYCDSSLSGFTTIMSSGTDDCENWIKITACRDGNCWYGESNTKLYCYSTIDNSKLFEVNKINASQCEYFANGDVLQVDNTVDLYKLDKP